MEGLDRYLCKEDYPLFPPDDDMVNSGNIYAFSIVFCLVLLGYLDPYHLYKKINKPFSHQTLTTTTDVLLAMRATCRDSILEMVSPNFRMMF